ncbi:aggregation factor core protein MAFp3, isoform C [Paenibacillus oenotherae]|uniref:Aggregation factor core protein MAFp3, isoform C n=1 Tax=Paenibacillus oenotherae TaxID=1435645 RepID=A0ABS7DAI8_9BACL|nr:Calx-beta domain-containing protein [Paenibacillus oenotherae]MBW7476958.1 aggregation factor core protein MAFp3, isoform C [Paenibacillus oenotherae]
MKGIVGRLPVKSKGRVFTSMLLALALSVASFGGVAYGDDTVPAEFSLDSNYYYIYEADGTLYVTVGLANGGESALSVDYTVNDGVAYGGSDYGVVSGTLTFESGQTTQTIEVPIYDDYEVEGDEDFSIQLSNPSAGAVLGANAVGYVTIGDDDYWIPDPPGELQLEPEFTSVNEGEGYVTLGVSRTNGAGGTVTVDYSTSSGSADENVDYCGTSGTLVFYEGETWQSIYIPIYEDAEYEGEENFTVSLYNASGGASLGFVTSSNVTITDNDEGPWNPGQFDFEGDSYSVIEGDGSQTAYLTVVRNNGTDGEVTVNYSTSNGSALSGSDYEAVSGTLTFAPGESYQTIAIPIYDDLLSESEESFTIALSDPTNGAALGSITTAAVTIEDNDITPPSQIQFAAASYPFIEELGWATLKVTRTGNITEAASVKFATVNGTAAAGSDYVAAAGTLNFAAGETSKTVKIKLVDDHAVEYREAFTVNLLNPTGNAVLGPKAVTEVVIYDKDHIK